MCWKMCATVALCLTFLVAFSEGFFLSSSVRKQAPQTTTTYANQHWIPSLTPGNGGNTIQGGFSNFKDFGVYQQQQQQSVQPQQQQQQQQQPQQQQQQPQVYAQQYQNVQATAPKYEPTPFQTVSQPLYAYEGYSASFNSYPQSVQLVPCLCPVSKEVMEQQNQQLQTLQKQQHQLQQQQQQNSLPLSSTSSSFPVDISNSGATPQANQKKNS